jgi:imidazole glycerol phosphate synthase glutamine amidotransferase subunit
MIAIVDYGAGNLRSVCNALDLLGQIYLLARAPQDLAGANGILLPGVGHFGQMMNALGELRLASRLQSAASDGTPLLGICLGMQAMFDWSDEAPGIRGLGMFSGTVQRFENVPRVPHMGWNDVEQGGSTEAFYFANSFYAPVGKWTIGTSEYGTPFSAIVRKGNVAGFQFHPEKSGEAGLKLLSEWCRSC